MDRRIVTPQWGAPGGARGIGRRGLLATGMKGGAVLLGATALAMPPIISARGDEPIRIGLLLAKTGDIAPQAEYLANGTYLALAEHGNTIMGRPAELVWLDEPSPQGAQQNMQKLVQENKVVAILGGALSSSALAEEAAAPGLKVPLLIENAAATDITGKNCNRYTFRLNTPVAVQARMFAPFALGYGKKWYFLTASYAFGQDIKNSFHDLLAKAGGTAVGGDEVPLNTPDYSSFILKIRQAQPDVVLGGVPAGDLSTFLKQWNELGMKGKIPIAEIAIGDTDIWAVGPEAATGIYTSLWWYKNPANPPNEQKFAADYLAKHGKPAADKAWMGWVMTTALIESIEAAKSTESAAIIDALEKWKGGTDANPYQFRKSDHQLMLRNLVVQVKDKITDKWDYFDVKAVVPQDASALDAVFGTPDQVGCHI